MIEVISVIFIFNIFAIIGFYAATDYEYADDILEFDATITHGSIQVYADEKPVGVISRTVEMEERQVQHYKLNIPHGAKVRFDEFTDAHAIIDSVKRLEYIDQESKQLLWFVRYYAKKWLGDKWCKPVACCTICMSSLHSIWYWMILIKFPFQWWMILIFLLYMVAMAGVQKLITERFEL